MWRLSRWPATAFFLFLSGHLSRIDALSAFSIPNKSTSFPTSATTPTSKSNTISNEIEALTHHPAIWSSSKSARKKLTRRHLDLFLSSSSPDNVLFNEFASVVCATGRMPRKELFETWAAALHIDAAFSQSHTRRIADVAAGHGLLAWALLIIDDARSPPIVRTVLCIDKRMPPSAEAIEVAMLEKWPHLGERFDFVQGSLEQLDPHDTCLLASVHACGGLSDLLVAIAAHAGVSVAVVPCCHSRKKLDGASIFAKEEYEAIIQTKRGPMVDLVERLDEARCTALRNAGFHVSVEMLPKKFTAKNRLIMASPPLLPPTLSKSKISQLAVQVPPKLELTTTTSKSKLQRQRTINRMPPLHHAKTKFLAKMTISCEDSHESRATIKALSGKYAANRRMKALHRKDHTDAPEHNISIWLPNEDGVLSEASLSALGCTIDPEIRCSARRLGETFQHSSGRRATTFRVRYEYNTKRRDFEEKSSSGGGGPVVGVAVSDECAKRVHDDLYARIAGSFPGAECR